MLITNTKKYYADMEELAAYRDLGTTPEELRAWLESQEDDELAPLPLPL